MALSKIQVGVAASLALVSAFGMAATPAYALDAGQCYSAEQVRAETWNAPGDAKQYTLIQGERTIVRDDGTRPLNVFTSTRDGSLGYNIEKSEDGRMCIGAKYTDIKVNTSTQRPSWVTFPRGSENDIYMTAQERDFGTRIVMTGRSIVHKDGEDYYGSQLIVTKRDRLVDGFTSGGLFTNDSRGNGLSLLSMIDVKTNPEISKFAQADTTRPQTTSLALNK